MGEAVTPQDPGVSTFEDVKGLTRDTPWLLSTNRKLRHLQGISLRNLSLVKRPDYRRQGTIDDQFVPSSLASPGKLVAQRVNSDLGHSRSSSDLRALASPSQGTKKKDSQDGKRPGTGGSRLSLDKSGWAAALPNSQRQVLRQKALEDIMAERLADTWFSIHCKDVQEPPIYVSESISRSMNPNYAFFDLNVYGPAIRRLGIFTIKFWAQMAVIEGVQLVIEMDVQMSSLRFVGKSLENYYHSLPSNCVLFHLTDGIYKASTEGFNRQKVSSHAKLPSTVSTNQKSKRIPSGASTSTTTSSSFDALMRLKTLNEVMEDALVTRQRLEKQVSQMILENKASVKPIEDAHNAVTLLTDAENFAVQTRRSLAILRQQKANTQKSAEIRHLAIEEGRADQIRIKEKLVSEQGDFEKNKEEHNFTRKAVSGQVRRICEDLCIIFPINPLAERVLCWTILDVYLPNSNSTDIKKPDLHDGIAAALSYVALLITVLAEHLSLSLPYPVTPHGSTSWILDPISRTLVGDLRFHPLTPIGTKDYRFDYGLYLVNEDIAALASFIGVRLAEPRHTLGNLKTILLTLSSGQGEVPERKKGKRFCFERED